MTAYFTEKELQFYNQSRKYGTLNKKGEKNNLEIKRQIPALRQKIYNLASRVVEEIKQTNINLYNNVMPIGLGNWILPWGNINRYQTAGIIFEDHGGTLSEDKEKTLFVISLGQGKTLENMYFNIRIGSYKYENIEDGNPHNDGGAIFYSDLLKKTEKQLINYCIKFIEDKGSHYHRYLESQGLK